MSSVVCTLSVANPNPTLKLHVFLNESFVTDKISRSTFILNKPGMHMHYPGRLFVLF